ncbi:hypothetical protein IH879_13395 [candidate division KSB1 bacterium]|nr:hypothetical protein [candidate division KSB1 bacterium]
MLNLYAFFHLNLAYSSIEEEQRREVVKRCYWPLLRLARRFNLPFGIEASGYTLEQIQAIDRGWIDELSFLISNGPCEFIGSGYAQVIAPLVPAEVNAANLRLGNQIYKQLLGVIPEVALINEQAYSAGILQHYIDAGYKAVAMEWDNPARFHPEWDSEWRYLPQYACGQHGEEIPLLWNNSIAFQKFQRYAHGDMEMDEYFNYLSALFSERTRFFPLYGNDVEIFNFRPNRYHTEAELGNENEWQRIEKLMVRLLLDKRIEFLRPSQVLENFHLPGAGNRLNLESTQQPVPVKKQDKYNITRWAVTGKNDLEINTSCWNFYNHLLNKPDASDDDWRYLCYLWSSDFRTHISEKRWEKYCQEMQRVKQTNLSFPSRVKAWDKLRRESTGQQDLGSMRSESEFPGQVPSQAGAWEGEMFQEQSFESPGDFSTSFRADGLCSGRNDFSPVISTPTLRGENLVTTSENEELKVHALKSHKCEIIQDDSFAILETHFAELTLNFKKGLAIEALCFKEYSNQKLIGTLGHGFYDDISLGADFFSGHTIFETPGHPKITDLNFVKPKIEQHPGGVEVAASVESPFGLIEKKVTLFSYKPQVDLEYSFDWPSLPTGSLRLGMITLNPNAFDPSTLYYSACNGGFRPERFQLYQTNFDHGSPVSFLVSASQGVGMTDGSIVLGDAHRAIRLQVDKTSAALIGMVTYKEITNSYFCRVSFSAKEMDETCGFQGAHPAQSFKKTFRISITPTFNGEQNREK